MYFQDAHSIAPVERSDGERGGIARLSTVLKEQNALYPDSSVLFGGDLAGGTLFGALYRGVPFVNAFNELGVDVASFGQHDFDFGAEHTEDLVAASDFPWVTSNLVNPDDGSSLTDNTFVEEIGDLKVGYIGLTGSMSNTSAAGDVIELDPIEAAKKSIEELRSQNVDVIVAITQIDKDESIELLEQVPEVDVLFREENSAAAQSDITELDDGRLIVSPEGDYGSVVRVDISVNAEGEKDLEYEVIQVDGSVARDPALAPVVEEYGDNMENTLGDTIAQAEGDFTFLDNAYLVADAFRNYAGTDLGWMNGGGIGNGITTTGDITYETAYSMLSFGNKVMSIEVTGSQIKEALEQAHASSDRVDSGGYPITTGFTYQYNPEAPIGSRVTDMALTDGTLITPDDTYTLALTDYVYEGGDNVTAFQDSSVIMPPEEGTEDVNALIEYVIEEGTVTPYE